MGQTVHSSEASGKARDFAFGICTRPQPSRHTEPSRIERKTGNPFPTPKRRTLTPDIVRNSVRYRCTAYRQSPTQLSPQSQSLSRSYGSSLPTSLTYMRLRLQRLRTLDTRCGYRVRSVPNVSGVYIKVL